MHKSYLYRVTLTRGGLTIDLKDDYDKCIFVLATSTERAIQKAREWMKDNGYDTMCNIWVDLIPNYIIT